VTQKPPEESDILMALSQSETRVSTEIEQTLELLRDPSIPAAIQRRYDWRNPIVEGTEYVVRSVDGIESIRFIPQFEQGSAHHATTLGREIRIEPLPAFRDNAERITDQFKVYGMSEVERPKGNLNEIYISTLVHEVTHREGGGEFLAFKAQFSYLLQSGAFEGNPIESTLRVISLYPPRSLAKSALEARAEGLSIEQLAPFLPGGESFRELRSTFRERRGEEPNPARDSGLGSFEASFYENLAVYFQSEAISAIPGDDPDYDQKIDAAMDIGDREAALFRRAVVGAQKRE
jgi:hypothetical protein